MKRAMIGVTLLCAIFFAGATAAWADTASYTNPVLGYTLTYPDDMQVDTSLENICTIFRNQECQIEVYYQPLQTSSYLSYVNYSNSGFLQNTVDHQNRWTSKQTINGCTVQITKWNRAKLKAIENDLNYYYTVDFRKSGTRGATAFLSSLIGIFPAMPSIWTSSTVSSCSRPAVKIRQCLFRKQKRNSKPASAG